MKISSSPKISNFRLAALHRFYFLGPLPNPKTKIPKFPFPQFHLHISPKFAAAATAPFDSSMASTSAVSMALPLTHATHRRLSNDAFFNPLPLRKAIAAAPTSNGRLVVVRSSLKEKAVTGLTAAALTAAMVIPEVAEAAGPGVSPSLKNFLLSIAAGGVVVFAILGAVIGVANFDPVKRS